MVEYIFCFFDNIPDNFHQSPILVKFSDKYINSKNRLPFGFQLCFRKSMGLDTEQSLPKVLFFVYKTSSKTTKEFIMITLPLICIILLTTAPMRDMALFALARI